MTVAPAPSRVVCFVSYDHDDSDFVDFLERLLGLYRDELELLRDRGGIDRRRRLDTALREMIARCDVFLPVVSPAHARSVWCQREYTWLGELRPAAAVVPLRLEPGLTAFPNHLGFDFAAWRVLGDRIVREKLVPTLTGRAARTAPVVPDLEAEAALGLARDFQVLGAGVNRADLRAPAAEAFTQLGIRLMQLPNMPAPGRARIAAAIAGQQIQRGQWAELRSWASLALAELKLVADTAVARSDDELAFIGERYTELALAERRLGDDSGAAHHYQEAADRYAAIRDALLRQVRRAQVHREEGTLATARLRLDEARQHYAMSRALLAGVPSEQMHVAQAWIKEAQVELVKGRDAAVDRCLDAAAELVEAPPRPVLAEVGPHELTARVAAHYWKSRAWVALARGQRGQLTHATAEHARVIAGYPWHNERAQQQVLRRAAMLAAVLPRPATRLLARAAIVAEAGLLARVLRPLRTWASGRNRARAERT